MAWRERLTDLAEVAADRAGLAVTPRERLTALEEANVERGALRRELDALAWTALDYAGGRPQELRHEKRLELVQKARVVWMRDPQAGAAVELMNDFTFGRGLPKPKANDELVQKVIDEAWDDPDNEDTLTSFEAQLTLGTDLALQANLFFLVFDDGEDGKVKLAMLDHDTVVNVVRDPEYRRRILYFVCREPETQAEEWDFVNDQPLPSSEVRRRAQPKFVYYEHWRNVERAQEEFEAGLRPEPPKRPPDDKVGDGKVFHVAINKTGEMAFGHPTFDRLIRWFAAYNRFMDARVDIMEASASFVMKRKVKGTPNQLAKMATQALSRKGALGMGTSVDPMTGEPIEPGPRKAGVLVENQDVEHEDFNLNTNAGNAAQDARMLGAQVSAATRFPRSYFGDAESSSLATATSLELPVLKGVERLQEQVERIVRFFVDRVIESAVDKGVIPSELTDEEREELRRKKDPERQSGAPPAGPLGMAGPPPLSMNGLGEAHEDAEVDEEMTERDLGYEFKMPNPLRRMLTDWVGAIMNVARTFDPNNTNMELSRTLLALALGEGLELEDPAAAVEKIFPEGYVDPAVAAAQAQMGAQPPGSPLGEFAPEGGGAPGADGDRHQADNPYGAPMKSSTPEQAARLTEGRAWPRDRGGRPLDPRVLAEVRVPEQVARAAARRRKQVERRFDEIIDEVGGKS